MKRPTKAAVIAAIREDYEHGRKRLIEAVALNSGVLIIEYEVRQRVDFGTGGKKKPKVHVQRRLLVRPPEGGNIGTILNSYFTEDKE